MTLRKTTHHPHVESHVEAAPSPVAASPAPAAVTPPLPAAPPPPPQPTQAASASAPASPPLVTTVANGSNHGRKVDVQAVYQAVVSGLLAYYQPTDSFHMPDGTYGRDSLIAVFNGFVTAAQATKQSNAEWRADIQKERVVEQRVKVLRAGLKGVVTARFGASGAEILKFGYALPKPRTTSTETKAVAAAKSKATREARGTMGKVQKQGIKGNVSAQLVVTDNGSAGTQQPSVAGAPVSNAVSGASSAAAVAGAGAAPVAVAPAVAPANGTAAPHVGANGASAQ
jgi:hypothetical protein